jgi:conjugative relaxase-like TrwC/TraI family protein
MTLQVHIAPGHDMGYPWKGQAEGTGGERTVGGYYINAAQQGEAPGRWFGKGAEALGFTAGQEVERAPYDAVYNQQDPRTGAQLGRRPGNYASKTAILGRLLAAEPHATAERVRELERQAEQAERSAHPYTDVTVAFSKSVSVVHASVRENARRAHLAGDAQAAAHYERLDARLQEGMQAANRAALEHLDKWAVTRTGYHGARVDGQEPGKYERAGLVATTWLQGTSRDGDPHDHAHNAIARMVPTERDGKWRALDTVALRHQAAAAKGIAEAHFQSFLVREMGVQLVPGRGDCGPEIQGVTKEQMEAYSSRSRSVNEVKKALADRFTGQYGREPNRSELKFISQVAADLTRRGKDPGEIDYHDYAARWDAQYGGDLARIAHDVGIARPSGATARRSEPRAAAPTAHAQPGRPAAHAQPDRAAEVRAMKLALARVVEKQSHWSRADLIGAMSAVMPEGAAMLPPDEAARLVESLADRAIAGEAGPVECLDAPEWPVPPAELLRSDLDGRSIYTRPGTTQYAYHVQFSREQQLVQRARRTGAPCLSREQAAEYLGASASDLEAWLREPAYVEDLRTTLPCGLSRAQGAVAFHALTSPRRVVVITAAAGTGKTTLAGVIAGGFREAGLRVAGTAPSQTATNELRAAINAPAWNNARFLGHTEAVRRAGDGKPMPNDGVLIMDEMSMTSLPDTADLVERGEAANVKLIAIGDPQQLTAVEGGGALNLLADALGSAQPPDPVRFAARWEQAASLRLRAGDASVLTEYADHGRIHGAPPEQAMEDARRAYVADALAGSDPLLMAHTRETCRELSRRIRDDLIHLGVVQDGPSVQLMGGAQASVGDLIICRKVDHNVDAGERGRGLANGDTLRVDAVDKGGKAVVRRLLDCDRQTGERRYGAAFSYGDFQNFDLAYAVTTHSAQGRTVTASTALVLGTENRQWLYTAMSRGAHSNAAIVATSPPKIADTRPGTRPAPELERYERIQHERAGHAPTPPAREPLEVHAGDREAAGILSDILQRDAAEVSASQLQVRNLAGADHLANLYARWRGETTPAITSRYEQELRASLPPDFQGTKLAGTATWLWRSLRAAEAAGLSSDQVIQGAVQSRSLEGIRDVAAVMDSRIREQVASLVPLPAGPWVEQVPANAEHPSYVAELAEAMDARKERLGQFTAESAPLWAVHALGPVPQEPSERLEWENRASHVAGYREMFGYDHPTEPIGPEPTADAPEMRSAWHAAFAALGPVDGIDLRGEPDGRLLLLRGTYETETAWAPRYVGNELRQVRAGAERAARDAVRADAEAKLARERGQDEVADRHEILARSALDMEATYRGHETAFADTMEARREWELATEHTRRMAVTADSEYRRRHPEEKLPPLRSAEPVTPSEPERQFLVPAAATDYQTPQWVTDLAERNRSAREKLDELQSMRVPSEDPEAADEGLAWPEREARQRDAILQPPKPEIKPAAQVMERAREGERAEADGPEAAD